MAADALSGARPGARRESHGGVHQTSRRVGIHCQRPTCGVVEAFQAGREVRVVLQAEDTTDAQAWDANRAIAKEVEERLDLPRVRSKSPLFGKSKPRLWPR